MNQGYYIGVDIAAMSLPNLIVMLIGIIVLITLVPIILVMVVRKLGIKNLGPIKMERRGQATEYYMNERTKAIDDACKRHMQQRTSEMKRSIHNMFAEMDVDVLARLAITPYIERPLFSSIANNHFTSELMPENFGGYREKIMKSIKDEYVSIARASKTYSYGRPPLPEWEAVDEQLSGHVDGWLCMVCKEVVDACGKKIRVYEEYLPGFKDAGDEFREGFTKNCVEKNERYIREIKARMGRRD